MAMTPSPSYLPADGKCYYHSSKPLVGAGGHRIKAKVGGGDWHGRGERRAEERTEPNNIKSIQSEYLSDGVRHLFPGQNARTGVQKLIS